MQFSFASSWNQSSVIYVLYVSRTYVRAFKLPRISLKWKYYKIDEILININIEESMAIKVSKIN